MRGIPKILDFGDMDSQKWLEYARYKPFPLSAGYWLEGKKLEREERRLARLFDLCTATTRAEWETLEGYGTGVATDWFPNGVDSAYFAPAAEPYDPRHDLLRRAHGLLPEPGVHVRFLRQRAAADAGASAAGEAAHRRRRSVAGGAASSGDLPGVTVTGSVPDVRPYLHRSALMVAPLNIARGTQNKILEAMAAGRARRRRAAWRRAASMPSPASTSWSADTPEEHAAAVLRILDDPARAAAPRGRRPRAHAVAPRLGQLHAAAGPDHRALPCGWHAPEHGLRRVMSASFPTGDARESITSIR